MTQHEKEHSRVDYYYQIARNAPRIDKDDKRVLAWQAALAHGEKNIRKPEHEKFHNNFFLLFVARKRKETLQEAEAIKIYLDHAEALGSSWRSFEEENQELLKRIDEALDGLRPYEDLLEQEAIL